MLFAFLSAVTAQAEVSKEYQLKAVLLWRFSQFVEWPAKAFPSSDTPIAIGVLGENPFGQALEIAVNGQTVEGRKIVVQYYRRKEEIQSCHILFVSRSEAGRWKEILQALRGRSILTVSDMEAFAQAGGMVRFVTQENRVNFRINLERAKAAGLVISSKLLRFADIVPNEQ